MIKRSWRILTIYWMSDAGNYELYIKIAMKFELTLPLQLHVVVAIIYEYRNRGHTLHVVAPVTCL